MAKEHQSMPPKSAYEAELLNELTETEVDFDERAQMIEEAAYFRAQQRGFHGDERLRDWLEAETFVDDMLKRVIIGQVEKGHK